MSLGGVACDKLKKQKRILKLNISEPREFYTSLESSFLGAAEVVELRNVSFCIS